LKALDVTRSKFKIITKIDIMFRDKNIVDPVNKVCLY